MAVMASLWLRRKVMHRFCLPRPEPGERDPEGAIERRQSRLRFLLIVCGKLLAKGKLNDHLLTVAPKEGGSAWHDQFQVVE
jgi:hypothetical protein